jgi:hypothetical protein
VTSRDLVNLVSAHIARNEISLTTWSESMGERFSLARDSAARALGRVNEGAQLSDVWVDRITVALDLQGEEDIALMQPGLDAFCPSCRQVQPSRGDGTCLWCDAQTGGNTIAHYVDRLGDERKEARSRNAGIPWKCSEQDIQEVRRLYLEGKSMRKACDVVHPRTAYANPNAMAMAMYSLFEQRGWNRRDQAQATSARNYKHGKARQPAHRRKLRIKNGYTRGVQCKGVKRNAPGAGKPCQMAAMGDSEYCRAHDPRFEELHRQHCRGMRAKRDEVAS